MILPCCSKEKEENVLDLNATELLTINNSTITPPPSSSILNKRRKLSTLINKEQQLQHNNQQNIHQKKHQLSILKSKQSFKEFIDIGKKWEYKQKSTATNTCNIVLKNVS